jgi:hypothetical protein
MQLYEKTTMTTRYLRIKPKRLYKINRDPHFDDMDTLFYAKPVSDFRGLVLRSWTFKENCLRGVDFRGVDLSGTNFSSCDLSGASFAGAGMPESGFNDCILTKADFSGAFMPGCTIVRTNLDEASFVRSDLYGGVIDRCSVTETDFTQARLARSTWADTDPSGVPEGWDMGSLGYLQLSEEYLRSYAIRVGSSPDVATALGAGHPEASLEEMLGVIRALAQSPVARL